jgi:hypothetical protein
VASAVKRGPVSRECVTHGSSARLQRGWCNEGDRNEGVGVDRDEGCGIE